MVTIFLSALASAVDTRADTIAINEKNLKLLNELRRIVAREHKLSEDDTTNIIAGLRADLDEVRVEAVKCVLIHRLSNLWNETRPDMKRGTSNKLAFIAYGLFGTARDINLPLIELLPSFVMAEAKKYRKEEHAFQRGGDIPLGLVLIDLIVKDTVSYSVRRNNLSHINSLKEFELSPDQTQFIRSVKKDF